jgi:hypothetical protein
MPRTAGHRSCAGGDARPTNAARDAGTTTMVDWQHNRADAQAKSIGLLAILYLAAIHPIVSVSPPLSPR